jgi:sarcosine oxidase, subunit beta
MGASAAFHLADLGVSTVLVDRGPPGGEASRATAGTLALQNKPPDMIQLVQRSLDLWEDLSLRLEIDVEYEKRGGFRTAHTEADIQRLETTVEMERKLGVDVEMVYPPQLRHEAPYLGSGIAAASYCPRDGMANPFATIRGFLRSAKKRGTELWSGVEVKNIHVIGNEDFSVETTHGNIRCSAVIAAAGAWNLEIARMVGVSLPVTTVLLQVTITDAGPPVFPHIVTHVRENLTVKQQRISGKIIIGGNWRGEGDRESGTKRVRRESLVGNLKWATEVIPAIGNARVLRSWVGFEGRTPDKILISGPIGPRGFYVLGCSYSGFTLSPIAGQIAAEYIVLGRTTIPSERFAVKRFASAGAVSNPL